MRVSQGGELDPAEGVRRRCMKNSSVLSCIGKRRLRQWQRSRDSSQRMNGEGPVTPMKLAGEEVMKDFVS